MRLVNYKEKELLILTTDVCFNFSVIGNEERVGISNNDTINNHLTNINYTLKFEILDSDISNFFLSILRNLSNEIILLKVRDVGYVSYKVNFLTLYENIILPDNIIYSFEYSVEYDNSIDIKSFKRFLKIKALLK